MASGSIHDRLWSGCTAIATRFSGERGPNRLSGCMFNRDCAAFGWIAPDGSSCDWKPLLLHPASMAAPAAAHAATYWGKCGIFTRIAPLFFIGKHLVSTAW